MASKKAKIIKLLENSKVKLEFLRKDLDKISEEIETISLEEEKT